jgi:hypothetical protein
LIKTVQGLWRRSAELAHDCPPIPFQTYPHADSLKLGWFPNKGFFRPECDERLWRALPEMTGIICAYMADFDVLSHVVVVSVRDDGTRMVKKRGTVFGRSRREGGIFGIQRMRKHRQILIVTDDETLALRHDEVVAINLLSPRIVALIKKIAPVVSLKSEDEAWLESMFPLAAEGIQIQVGDLPLVDWVVARVIKMYHDHLGLSLLTNRLMGLIEHLVPMERVAVIQMLKDATNVNFEHALPDDFSIFRREGEFYTAVIAKLDEKVASVQLSCNTMILTTHDEEVYEVPLHPLAIQAAVCEIMGAPLDFVDWAYDALKEIPNVYLFRDKRTMDTRAAVSARIGEVVTSVLTRKARMKR